MKLTNPFASVRNFIRSNHTSTSYTPYAPAFESNLQHASTHEPDTHNLFLPMQDRSLLLRPLSDTHLMEVYQEAKAMQLSEEFIALIEHAIEQRGLSIDDERQSLA
ncbi:sporulation histidine kinase inhibitor Sda [Paenibacillus rhizovicinus]|uniref:Sporulation histidine kinase inhibitor Sda n=1 Tax=Paenibacillus rhizovicinus TaxID=2704463 RepID=A0A6C0P0E9_9BACL|nr:sporulation histidine kinase inhibitor Sda [Paenibacillus rhizovicinus]QHW31948.1 sporulation histidine kinase inhibitor Sda [Paenibacillus rhizovicinus]